MSEEKKEATDAGSTSEENQEEEEEKSEEELATEKEAKDKEEAEAKEAKEAEEKSASEDINYAEELNKLQSNETPTGIKPSQRSEEEKAKFTVDKIYERFPDLKEKSTEDGQSIDEAVSTMTSTMLRNQVEGIIRGNSKSDDEVKYKMYFYDKRIQQTGNIHEDADNAEWLANKTRTRNAIKEIKRDPGEPGSSEGAGQKTPSNVAPELPPEEHQKLIEAGFKKVSESHYESSMFNLKWDAKAQKWDQTKKQS